MTNPGGYWKAIDVKPIKHICLVANNCAPGFTEPFRWE